MNAASATVSVDGLGTGEARPVGRDAVREAQDAGRKYINVANDVLGG